MNTIAHPNPRPRGINKLFHRALMKKAEKQLRMKLLNRTLRLSSGTTTVEKVDEARDSVENEDEDEDEVEDIHDYPLWTAGSGPTGLEIGDCKLNWNTDDMDNAKKGGEVACGCPMTHAQKISKYVHPCCQKEMVHLLRIFDLEMDKNKLKYLLVGGAVIGWWRNKKMIPYDGDLDVNVKLDLWASDIFMQTMRAIATNHGLCVYWSERFKLKICKLGMCLDIWPVQFQDGLAHVDFFKFQPQPVSNMYPEKVATFEGIETYIPHDPVKYNDAYYGVDAWHQPLWTCEDDGSCRKFRGKKF